VIYILSNRIRLIYRNICTVPYRNKNILIDAKTKLNRSKRILSICIGVLRNLLHILQP